MLDITDITPNDDDNDDFDDLTTLLKAVANKTRITILIGILHGKTAKDIQKSLKISRGGLQNNLNKLAKHNLLYRPSGTDTPTYALTPIGTFFAQFLDDHAESLLDASRQIDTCQDQLAADRQGDPVFTSMDSREREKLLHTNAVEDTYDDLANQLNLDEDDREIPAEAEQ